MQLKRVQICRAENLPSRSTSCEFTNFEAVNVLSFQLRQVVANLYFLRCVFSRSLIRILNEANTPRPVHRFRRRHLPTDRTIEHKKHVFQQISRRNRELHQLQGRRFSKLYIYICSHIYTQLDSCVL